jgi:hypothetical protein
MIRRILSDNGPDLISNWLMWSGDHACSQLIWADELTRDATNGPITSTIAAASCSTALPLAGQRSRYFGSTCLIWSRYARY